MGEEDSRGDALLRVWSDPDGALNLYLEQKDALHAGRKPRPDPDAITIKDIANDFLDG